MKKVINSFCIIALYFTDFQSFEENSAECWKALK